MNECFSRLMLLLLSLLFGVDVVDYVFLEDENGVVVFHTLHVVLLSHFGKDMIVGMLFLRISSVRQANSSQVKSSQIPRSRVMSSVAKYRQTKMNTNQ